jgi:hypothetical protein
LFDGPRIIPPSRSATPQAGARNASQGGPQARARARLVLDWSEHAGIFPQIEKTLFRLDVEHGIYRDTFREVVDLTH